MNKKLKTVLLILLVLVVAGGATAYFQWNKPKRDVSLEKGLEVTAAQLVKDYQANEPDANKKYLDKAIQVTGVVGEVSANQDGKTTITLTTDDPFTAVFCTLKETNANITSGATITLKGICSGMLTDVRIRDAAIVKE